MAKYEVLMGFCLSAGVDVLPKQVVDLGDDEVLRIGMADRRLRRLGERDKTKIVEEKGKRIEVMESDPRPTAKGAKEKTKTVLDADGKTKIEVPEDDPRPAVK